MSKEHVCIVNGHSIYWNPFIRRFTINRNNKQIYDTEDLYGAIEHALEVKKWSKRQLKRFIKLSEMFDTFCTKLFIDTFETKFNQI